MSMLSTIGLALRRFASTLRNPSESLRTALGIAPTLSGITVNENIALTYSAFYSGVRVISESVAGLPLVVYKRIPRGKEVARDHPVSKLLRKAPNPLMTPFMFLETLTGNTCTWGNGYAGIERDGNQKPVRLWPFSPDRVRVISVEEDEVLYGVQDGNGSEFEVESNDMLHVRMISADGLVGWSPVRLHREAIGLGLATERHGATFFGNSSRPDGILTTPGKLDKPAVANVINSWERMHRGPNKAHKVALLQQGLDWKPIGIPNDDAQFLETRIFQVAEIARILRIPPHMIGDLEHATFSNIESMAIQFVVHSLRPWLVRWEQEINTKLFPDDDEFFAEFRIDALLRGDTKSRMQSNQIAIQNGIFSRNEVREMENRNPYEGGDEFLTPMNMTVGAEDDDDKVEKAEEVTTNDEPKDELKEAATAACLTDFERVLRKERNAIKNAVKRKGGSDQFAKWVRDWYDGYVTEAYGMVIHSYEVRALASGLDRAVGALEAEREVREHCAAGRADILKAISEGNGNYQALVIATVAEWEKD